MYFALKLIEGQGTVVKGAGQAEAVVHKAFLAAAVAGVHGAHLRQRHMAFVHEKQEILGEIVQQRHGRCAGCAAGDYAGIVLDAAAKADLLQHFDVIHRPLADALRLQQLIVFLEPFFAFLHLFFDLKDGAVELFARGDVVRGGIDGNMADHALRQSRDGIDFGNAVDLVAEEFHADGTPRPVGGIDLHGVAADAEVVAGEVDVVALIADVHELAHQLFPRLFHARAQGDDHVLVVDRVAQTVDAGNRGEHDHVSPLEEGGCRTVAQALDLVIDGGVLFNIRVRVGDVCLRLIVIIVGNEVFHRVFREKLPEFRTKLGGERFVVRQHQRRTVQLLDHGSHGEGLAGAGDAQQNLRRHPLLDPARQGADGLRLVAGGGIGRMQFEIHRKHLRSRGADSRCRSWKHSRRPR